MEKAIFSAKTAQEITLEDLEIEAEGSVQFGPGNVGPRRDIGGGGGINA